MDLNRNQYFMIGIVLVLLGFQFRHVDHYVLNNTASRFLEERLPRPVVTSVSTSHPQQQQAYFTPAAPTPRPPAAQKTIRPPEWLSWILLSVGAVLTLHSLAMKKPG